MPPNFNDGILSYIDLDIDVFVPKDFAYETWDLDEFHKNSLLYQYSSKMIEQAGTALDELKQMVEQRVFPFDHSEK
jgi:protein associated with RNAse G/E